MTAEQMAALHMRCFTHPRPWSAAEIAAMLDSRGAFLLNRPEGFLIGRVILDEAELLTLAIAPEARRLGIGRALCADFASHSRTMGGVQAFLEVSSDNAAARALYFAQGWTQAGLRRGYYAPGIDALTLRLTL